ncbi:MAG TPA: ABATE domain-containing protein [Actinoplanes sp.]|jgi:predicted RNA-binding Zn ribbon-like protein
MFGFPELYGGAVCLDFANTLDGRATQDPEEYLHSYADLVSWAEYAGVLDPATARRLAGPVSDDVAAAARRASASLNDRAAARQSAGPSATDVALRIAVDLREAIFGVFAAVGRGEDAPEAFVDLVQLRYADAMAAARLAPGDDGFDWQFGGDAPDRAWWPIAVSAVSLLTAGPLNRVKVCAAEEGCIGLFLDTSKNRSRRWCTMDGCGVEAKVQRQARRRRSARTGS